MPAAEARQGWLLAGGLHPGNVATAAATAKPTAVDVSSGVCGPDGELGRPCVALSLRASAAGSGRAGLPLQPARVTTGGLSACADRCRRAEEGPCEGGGLCQRGARRPVQRVAGRARARGKPARAWDLGLLLLTYACYHLLLLTLTIGITGHAGPLVESPRGLSSCARSVWASGAAESP